MEKSAPRGAELARSEPQRVGFASLGGRRCVALSKEIAATPCCEQRTTRGGTPRDRRIENGACMRAFHAIELSLERPLACTARTRVPSPQPRNARSSGDDTHVAEGSRAERIANANVPIEIGERWNAERIALLVLDDDGEPEAELTEPHRCGIDVDAEDRSCEKRAT